MFLVLRNKLKRNRNRSSVCFGSNRIFFLFVSSTPYPYKSAHRGLLTGTPELRVSCRAGGTRCSTAHQSPPSCSHRPIDNVVFIKKGKYTQRRTNTKNSKQIFPEKELRGHSPNFRIHVSVSDLYIPMIHLPILLQEIWGPILGIYKSLTDT